ncbi:hypothetical protein MRBLRC7O_000927 [Agrobacterium radiobacter]|uniref:hypothetical protein n=1 Tax=Agrobacterium radiobacter TaxID=362 RepID=UPI003464FE4C
MPVIDITKAPFNASASEPDILPKLQAAVSAIGADGGEIFIPDTFNVSGMLTLPNTASGYLGIKLRGSGRGSGLKASASFSGDAIIKALGGCSGVENMDISCESIAPRAIWSIGPAQGFRSKFKDIHVTHATVEAIRVEGPGDYLIDDFHTNSCALAVHHAGDAKNSVINALYVTGGDGVVFSSSLGSCEGVTLSNSHILPTGGHGAVNGGVGVMVLGANGLQIVHSWIDCCKNMAIWAPSFSNNRGVKLVDLWMASDTGKCVLWEAGTDLAIDLAQCENASPNVAQISLPASELGKINGVTITNSVFSDVLNIGNVGVYASRVRGMSIINNRFRNRGTSIAESNGADNIISLNRWTHAPASVSPSTQVSNNIGAL